MTTPQEVAKKSILEKIEAFDTENRKALLFDIAKALGIQFDGTAAAVNSPAKKLHKRYFFAIGMCFLAALLIACLKGGDNLVGSDVSPRLFIAFLAFVVALAGYLAGVVRETIRRLGAVNESDRVERLKLKRYAAWITTAEIQLVLLGGATIFRVAAGPGPFLHFSPLSTPILFDNVLVGYLCAILVLLAGLHARVWWSECPFYHSDGK
jgi:hypothetical protein